MTNQIILASLAMDLKRAALGLNRKSFVMAEKFSQEALQRQKEIDITSLPTYLQQILNSLPNKINSSEDEKKAEDMLMYSTLIQNYALNDKT